MWARIAEVLISIYLSLSSFFFPYPQPLWMFNLCIASWIWFFYFATFYHPLRNFHYYNLFAALALIVYAFIQPDSPPPPPFQNYVVIGLVLFIFGIIPNHASIPPEPWRRYYSKKREEKGRTQNF